MTAFAAVHWEGQEAAAMWFSQGVLYLVTDVFYDDFYGV
jgi:hypothetical protein